MSSETQFNIEELAAQFATPPPEFSPTPIWWWSGSRLERQRLRWQMEQLIAGGIHNVVIMNLAPTSPLFGADADDPLFMSEEWWEIFLVVCEDAKELGMRIWFYDQIGFSGANLQGEIVRENPSYIGQALNSITAEGEDHLQLECPPEGIPLAAYWIALDRQGTPQGKPVTVNLNGRTAVTEVADNKRLRLIYAVWHGFDYYNPEACARLLDIVHYEFERHAGHYFGDVIAGSFQDELPDMLSWGATFTERFAAIKGYNLIDHLPALFEGDDPDAERVRVDYHQVRALLAEEAFFKPLFEWHEKHGLICGFDQQGPARGGEPISTVRTYADYLQTHRWFSAPGSDHHGNAKIHSSLAHLYDRPRVWIEAFHTSGWGGTLEETFDWLLPWLLAGATLYDPHAVYYSTHGGWWEWAPPSTCWRQPYWRHYHIFANTVTRLCYLLSQGHHVCDIGVLFPTTTVQSGLTLNGSLPTAQAAHDTYIALTGKMKFLETVVGVLDADKRDYDVLDDASVQRGQVTAGCLQIGTENYRAIILPGCKVLEAATAERLDQFVESGGLLIAIGQLPDHIVNGTNNQLEKLKALFAEGKAVWLESAALAPTVLDQLPRTVEAPVPVLHRKLGNADVVFIPAAYPNATHSDSTSWHYAQYDFDSSRYQRPMQIVARGFAGSPQLWNPVTGEQKAIPTIQRDDGGVEISLDFNSAPAAVLVWSNTVTGEDSIAPAATNVVMSLPEEWECEIEQTLDNRFGDLDKPNHDGAPAVQTWYFEHQATSDLNFEAIQMTKEWSRVVATYGTYGWLSGVRPITDLPEPLPAITDFQALNVEGWEPAEYSLQRGIHKDDIHIYFLGPKGHVPEEFLKVPPLGSGEGEQFRTTVWMPEDTDLHFALAAPVRKYLWINGEAIQEPEDIGYLWMAPITLKAGLNLIEWRLVSENLTPSLPRKTRHAESTRAYWALVTDAEKFIRPERIIPLDAPVKDSLLTYALDFDLEYEPTESKIHVLAAAPCRVRVNGVEVGRQGDFEPYDIRTRVQLYKVTNFRKGPNTIELLVTDSGPANYSPADGVPKQLNGHVAMMLDGIVNGTNGESQSIISGIHWLVRRDHSEPAPVTLYRPQWFDPPWTLLWRRPHPLPESNWLDSTPTQNAVLPVIPDAFAGQTQVEWFRWHLPPGAVEMKLPVAGQYQIWIDGDENTPQGDTVIIPPNPKTDRSAYLRVVPERGRTGGAVFTDSVSYKLGTGHIKLGNWSDQGLHAFSGGLRYRANVFLENVPSTLTLDLGQVRGTVEVLINGKLAGVSIWSPYVFPIGTLAQRGENTIEVLVLNTLAPYLDAVSPTSYIREGQTISGIMGPVVLKA